MTYGLDFKPRTLRRLARSPYSPIEGAPVLRVDTLARLLVERLSCLGAMTETEAIDVLNVRAPGRGADVVGYAIRVGLVRRAQQDDQPPTLEALGRPLSRAA